MGRDLHCSREVEGIVAYAEGVLGQTFYVSSTLRAGAITLTGNLSNHALALAVDLTAAHANGAPWPTIDSPELLRIFKAFQPVAAHLAELIYCGPGASLDNDTAPECVKHGRLVPPYACSIHHNHVHVAVARGVYLADYLPGGPLGPAIAERGAALSMVDVNERTDMAAGITVPRAQGGYAILQTRDGGVFTYDDAPFFGSMVDVAPGPFVAFTWTLSGEGYWILDGEGAVFAWGDAQYHGGVNAGPLVEHFGTRTPVGLVALPDGTYNIIGQDLSGDASPFDAYHLPI